MSEQQIGLIPLHDAVLYSVEYSWQQKYCWFNLSAFAEVGSNATGHVLEFEGVTSVALPHQEPWGPSVYVDSATQAGGIYKIHMQSGDILEIVANGFTFFAL